MHGAGMQGSSSCTCHVSKQQITCIRVSFPVMVSLLRDWRLKDLLYQVQCVACLDDQVACRPHIITSVTNGNMRTRSMLLRK